MKALELEKIVHIEEAQSILKKAQSEKLEFKEFSKELIVLMDKIAEEDFQDILNSYSVPAERIIKTLKFIKEKLLSNHTAMVKDIDFAIQKILD